VRLFLELRDQSPRPLQIRVEIVDPEEQQQAVAGRPSSGLIKDG
jgi:hypothetical protein